MTYDLGVNLKVSIEDRLGCPEVLHVNTGRLRRRKELQIYWDGKRWGPEPWPPPVHYTDQWFAHLKQCEWDVSVTLPIRDVDLRDDTLEQGHLALLDRRKLHIATRDRELTAVKDWITRRCAGANEAKIRRMSRGQRRAFRLLMDKQMRPLAYTWEHWRPMG
jgi:hypothetical protein